MLVCRRPGRGINTGLSGFIFASWLVVAAVPGGVQIRGCRALVCKAAAAFVQKCLGFLKSALFLPAFPLGVTGWLAFLLGFTVRILDVPFDTVRMCVDGGMGANVFTCFSVTGTVLVGVTVWLFFPAGVIGDPRVVLIFCISPGGSGLSFCPAALSLLRGFGPDVFVVVGCSLRHLAPDRVLASVLCSFWSWGLPPSWAGYKYGAHHAGISSISILVLVCWCLPPSRAGKKYGALTAGISLRSSRLLICWFVLKASATFRVCWRVP